MVAGTTAFACGSCGCEAKKAEKSDCGSCKGEKKQTACGETKKVDKDYQIACGGSKKVDKDHQIACGGSKKGDDGGEKSA